MTGGTGETGGVLRTGGTGGTGGVLRTGGDPETPTGLTGLSVVLGTQKHLSHVFLVKEVQQETH